MFRKNINQRVYNKLMNLSSEVETIPSKKLTTIFQINGSLIIFKIKMIEQLELYCVAEAVGRIVK